MGSTSDLLVRFRSLARVRSYHGSTVGNVNQGGKEKTKSFWRPQRLEAG
jgi:adenosylmethionine-8-amino-7-oxononanoate aminotransferase